ncbi:hypothetical protein AC579_6105 [Pseudocercospora musae]|uniref:Zn(2)-C6 fungal-type domain-containing protein n=1 Tax=Pseudocercospora musae TaxID=113226 RepID=A0A139I713_9PEZI|nr:hypothetical protein AC579_6105 [Pseudocercospora musae]
MSATVVPALEHADFIQPSHSRVSGEDSEEVSLLPNRSPPPSARTQSGTAAGTVLQTSSATSTHRNSSEGPSNNRPEPQVPASSSSAKKRTQVRHACLNRRNNKIKCSGAHPECSRCLARSLSCSYDVPVEGLTKTQHLMYQFAEQTERLERVSAILDIFRNGTDKQAAEALTRLRIGERIETVLDRLSTQPLDPVAFQHNEAMPLELFTPSSESSEPNP